LTSGRRCAILIATGFREMSPARQLEFAFEDAPRWDEPSLETALAREAGRPLRLVLTDNRSVLLSFKREAGRLLLRLHRMFLHAPDAAAAGPAAARCGAS
jgi:hypothetical protein